MEDSETTKWGLLSQLSNVLNGYMWLLFRYNYKLSIIEDVYNVFKNNGVLQ